MPRRSSAAVLVTAAVVILGIGPCERVVEALGFEAKHASGPPSARARRITSRRDLFAGPLAQARVGDWLLENEVARFAIQDVGQRDLWSVGQYGGNLIDAELRRIPGRDHFLELQPSVNIESVINAQTVEIVNDGSDGAAAVLRTCGPDDLLDFINPSTNIREFGFEPPAAADDADYAVVGCTEYTLEPGVPYLKLVTTIFSDEADDLPLFVGDYVNGNGELDPWAVTAPSTLISGGGIGESLTGSLEGLEYIGFGEAAGVGYSFVSIPFEGALFPSDYLNAGGVSVILQNASIVFSVLLGTPPSFVVPAGGSKSFTRYFGVSDGSDGGAVALQAEISGRLTGRLQGCVRVGGKPAPDARVAVAQLQANGAYRDLVAHFVADEDGCYAGPVPVGSYVVVGGRTGTPYEGGGGDPLRHPVSIVSGGLATVDIELPATGRLRVRVVDDRGRPLPARVSVIGTDPSPEPTIVSSGLIADLLGPNVTGLFRDRGDDGLPAGFARIAYAGAKGVAEFEIEPGDYQVFVSRGFEYSLYDRPVTVVADARAELRATIAPVLDTDGFVSSDFHVHGIMSADSRTSHRNRVMQFAGEGVDNIVMTDHAVRTDLNPTIRKLGLRRFVHATIGEEITSWDYGHFNGYPYRVDPDRLSGGSLDWAGAAPPGLDFPAYGAFSITPRELDELGRTGPGTTRASQVQINHIGSTFGPLRIDSSLVPPRSMLTPEQKLAMRLDPETGDLYHHFRVMELVNGNSTGAVNGFFQSLVGIWFNHLNQGLHVTGVGVSDTHGLFGLSAPGARTWTASPTDDPDEIDPQDVAGSVEAGRASIGMGAFLTTRLVAEDGRKHRRDGRRAADLGWRGRTSVSSRSGDLTLEISVQAPVWAPYDRIEIYANSPTHPSGLVDGIPVFFGATPQLVLHAGADFDVKRVRVDRHVPGAERFETRHSVRFDELAEDTWFVVAVRGTPGVSHGMFPVAPSGGGALAWAVSNPLYADVDGVPGFQAPLAAAE